MKILGIGNAIVDVLCKVNDEFLNKHSLTKSTMKLIDEVEFQNLISEVKIEEKRCPICSFKSLLSFLLLTKWMLCSHAIVVAF